jgi:hypothetical protein
MYSTRTRRTDIWIYALSYSGHRDPSADRVRTVHVFLSYSGHGDPSADRVRTVHVFIVLGSR